MKLLFASEYNNFIFGNSDFQFDMKIMRQMNFLAKTFPK